MKRLFPALLIVLAFAPALIAKTCASRFPTDQAWWQPSSAKALAKAVEPFSTTLATYIANDAVMLNKHNDICIDPAISQARIARKDTVFAGNTTYVPKQGTFVTFSELVSQPTAESVKWVITLQAPVKRLKPGVDVKRKNYKPTPADFETFPDIELEADRVELMVEPGNVTWSVFKGEQMLGTGTVPIPAQ